MSKPIIAVDMDDVLTQGVDSFRKQINRQTGSDLTLADYLVPDGGGYTGYFTRVWERHGIADKIDLATLNDQMIQRQTHIVPTDGAYEALERLSRRYKLIIMTDRPPEWKAATLEWLEKYYDGLFDTVYFRREHGETKGDVCKQLGVSLLIDDNPAYLQSAIDAGIPVILYGEYGWHGQAPDDIVRCKDWPAVEEYLRER